MSDDDLHKTIDGGETWTTVDWNNQTEIFVLIQALLR